VLHDDAGRVHTGQTPLILAMLRNTLVSFLHALGFARIRQGCRHFALNIDEASYRLYMRFVRMTRPYVPC